MLGNEAFSASSARSAFCSVGPSRRIEALRLAACDAVAATVVLKLVTRSRSSTSLRPRPSVVRLRPSMRRERSWRWNPEERVGHDRGALQRALAVADRVVQRLAGALAARAGIGVGVLRLGGLVVQAGPQPVQRLAQAGARVALQRAQHLVELHRRRRLGDGDGVAVVDGRRRGRAGRDVDEEVALQEDPRADLEGGVLVDRQALPGHVHRHHGRIGAGLALDLDDLADVHARDAHRGVLADRVRGLEDRLDPEAVGERHVLGEAEEDADAHDDEDHDADHHGVRAHAVLARHALVV